MPPKLPHCICLNFFSILKSMLAILALDSTSSSSPAPTSLFFLPPVICCITSWKVWMSFYIELEDNTIWQKLMVPLSITLRMLMKRRRPRRPTAEWEVIPRTECPGGFPSLAKVDQNRLGVLIFDKKKRISERFGQWLNGSVSPLRVARLATPLHLFASNPIAGRNQTPFAVVETFWGLCF